jgi:hypothetical protein
MYFFDIDPKTPSNVRCNPISEVLKCGEVRLGIDELL